ncbi:MAG: sodium:proton antiporter, partial [Pseudonocardia sp.]|nr:sodium:proton antiporter [Pseudonocardia sp.]
GRELGLPRRMLTILGGESLVNDATALTAYRVAIAAAVGGGVTLLEAGWMFLLAAVGGVLVGFALAVPLHWIRMRTTDPVLEIAVGLLVPFAAYIVAEELHTSGVLAVVVAGLYLGHRSTQTSSGARLQGDGIWRTIDFVLESVVFALIGLQLRIVLDELAERSLVTLLGWGLLVTALVIALRFVWVFPATYLPRLLVPRIRRRDPAPSPQSVVVVSWAGMRGVVSLAAAFALAADFPARDLIVWLTFCVVIGTLVIQGLTLPWVIRRLGVTAEDSSADDLAEAAVGHRAAQASIARLDELAGGDGHHVVVAEQLRHTAEKRANSAWERLGSNPDETPAMAYKRLRREMLAAERDVFVKARNDREVDDEVLRRVLRELDLEEVMLQRE